MPRLDQERQKKLEPKRIEKAAEAIVKLGLEITVKDAVKIQFIFKGSTITFFPYSGWHSGKTVVDGRGLEKLLKQLR